jgi:hypothetical protein
MIPSDGWEPEADGSDPTAAWQTLGNGPQKPSTRHPASKYHKTIGPTIQTRKMTMLTLELPPETEKKLQDRAAQAGQSVESLVRQLF